ncbi:MAG TPA: dihydrolipoamide acetyltransferase family protein [Solirubrobacterales bacterium]|jgi:pyruvate dehydrogenase E2 component (dihydrolipoamide acetyltransferase)|nr:dihydrolipoamide acetyltransferase family protein [Solirubrobacterales bacterium]
MAEIVMPRLSDSMEEGTVIKWLKSVGDEVAVGDELVEIETDKANMVYEADSAGTLTEIVAEEGATMPIGEIIARVGEAGDVSANGGGTAATEDAKDVDGPSENGEGSPETVSTGSDSAPAQPASAPEAPTPSGAPAAAPAGDGADGGGRVKASPIAKRIASDKGVDLHALAGSGPGGRIIKVDVERAATAPGDGVGAGAGPAAAEPAPPTPGASERPETAKGQTEVVELSKLQQTVARRMAESKATAPHFYLETEIDMSAAFRARKRLKEMAGEGEPVPTFNDMVVKACAVALRDFPRANGAYRDGRIELYSRVNVGVAVAAQDALVVPTVFDADQKGLRQIAAETRALAQRVREGQITPPELSGGTFTVSNLGMYGVTNFGAVINTPQAGILAVGELKPKAVVRDGEIVPRELMGVTLACDHRILYGADGAQFLARVRALLEEPIGLAL